ncbi:hypothetical protein BU23DRAFT_572360 [Bimuria novae-zelandiae CBS 107.79]|uniref:Uncharacterized protein n=1 Tax=Bimuria novae-zelandiae CBS 107.79 TaxID=1447943 RepID=A0A6A5UU08_9PLEO|nr:hypothetical protein BU23DRAFT_572360 [Bimuria novae-zelandiae CBS 107.79]
MTRTTAVRATAEGTKSSPSEVPPKSTPDKTSSKLSPKRGSKGEYVVEDSSKIPIHTIILFPADYDDPGNDNLSRPAHADNALSTHPHPKLERFPLLPAGISTELDDNAANSYFSQDHFMRVQRRLNYKQRNPDGIWKRIPNYADEDQANEELAEEPVRFLHHITVFLEILRKENHFRTIYAPDLKSALRHAQDLTKQISESYPHEVKTPVSATFSPAPRKPSKDQYERSPTTPLGTKQKMVKDKLVPRERVMILAYRNIGSRLQMDARAHELFMHENVLLYPSQWEVGWDNPKVHDLLAFDAIDEKRKGAWRPAWHSCDPWKKECEMPEDTWREQYQLLKRGHSSCANTVERFDWKDHQEPVCQTALRLWREEHIKEDLVKEKRKETRGEDELAMMAEDYILHESRFYKYIHQEYIESLYSWGELRVFVATKWDKGLRGEEQVRVPYVVDIIKTTFTHTSQKREKRAKELKATKVTELKELLKSLGENEKLGAKRPELLKRLLDAEARQAAKNFDNDPDHASDPNDPRTPIIRCTYKTDNMLVSRLDPNSEKGFDDFPDITYAAIANFALAQYRRLYRRFPNTFSSLEVGARIDLGIAPNGKTLFINEVTRWWFASWFSAYEDMPFQSRVTKAFAKSFAEVYKPEPRDYITPARQEEIDSDNDRDDDDDEDRPDKQKRKPKPSDTTAGGKNTGKRPPPDGSDDGGEPPKTKAKKGLTDDEMETILKSHARTKRITATMYKQYLEVNGEDLNGLKDKRSYVKSARARIKRIKSSREEDPAKEGDAPQAEEDEGEGE